jgi:hypothetical protein
MPGLAAVVADILVLRRVVLALDARAPTPAPPASD